MRVIVNGAAGKMGSLAVKTLEQNSKFTVIGKTHRTDNLNIEIKKLRPDIIVDLTTSEVVYDNTLTIIKNKVHPVIGTSGLTADQVKYLQQLCTKDKLGGLIVPNFSIGALVMMQCAKMAVQHFSKAEIIEMHHEQKLDSPSGTATKTAAMLRSSNQNNIPIHSLRIPGVLANQQIVFGNMGETLTITHNTIDRACFMPGLIFACEQVTRLHGLVYGLEQLIF